MIIQTQADVTNAALREANRKTTGPRPKVVTLLRT